VEINNGHHAHVQQSLLRSTGRATSITHHWQSMLSIAVLATSIAVLVLAQVY
jgi:hypothetical protein